MSNTHKYLQLLFSLLISHKHKAYQGVFNIRREQMEAGELSSQGAQPLLVGVDEQCEQGAESPRFITKKFGFTANMKRIIF